MRRIAYIVFFVSINVCAQKQKIDSLLAVNESLEVSPEKVNTLLKLADLYNYSGQQDIAQKHIDEAMEMSKDISYVAGEARSLWKLADLALNTDIALAKSYLQRSLKLSYESEDDETIVGTMNELGYYYLYYVPLQSDSARDFFSEALEINNDRFPADSKYSYRFLSSYYNRKGESFLALDYIDSAINLDTTNLYAWNAKATILNSVGRDTETIEVYLKIIREGEKINNPFVRTFERNLASVYLELKDYDQALIYSKSALQKQIASGDLMSIVQANSLVSSVYMSQGKLDSAETFLNKAVSLVEANELKCMGDVIYRMANLNKERENYDLAIDYYRKSVAEYESCGNVEFAAWSKIGIAKTLLLKGDYAAAEKRLLEVKKNINVEQYPPIARSLSLNLYETYKNQNRFDLALEQYEKNRVISDSLFSAENDAEIARLEANHEFEKEKTELIATQQNKKIEFDHKLRRSRLLFYLTGIGLLIVGFFTYIIYRSYLKYKRARNIIAEKNEVLELTTKELKDLSDFKQGMTNMIAHDIKNPLNSIIYLSQSIRNKTGREIGKAGGIILQLISNMLDVEKYDDTKPILKLESVLLSNMIEEAVLSVDLLLHDKSIRMVDEITVDGNITVDKEMILRVLVNLLSNAIKFSPANDSIHLKGTAFELDGKEYVKLGIEDHGQGISEKDQHHVFDKFYQSEAKKLGFTASTGLGLTFCQMAMKAHNGLIGVISEKGKGSTFWITLELSESTQLTVDKIDTASSNISDEERQLLRKYSSSLKELKVHNISAIMDILEDIDKLKLKSNWSSEVRSAVRYANNERYFTLIKMIE